MPVTVILLSLCQALLVSGNILLVAVSPLIGAKLAPGAGWATAPVAMQWLGLMCATIPASLIMARLGRKRGFVLGNLVGLGGVGVASLALINEQFLLFMLSTWLLGIGIGFGMLYRFAAVEAAAPEQRDRAIGLVMGGGVLAAFFGPWLARASRALVDTPFLGSFLGLGMLYLLALVILLLLRLPPPQATHSDGPARPMAAIMRQPAFIIAVLTGLIGYGVMNLAMTATPLAMEREGFHFDHVATTIQWHVLAMYLPAFFTGWLTARMGPRPVIVLGCLMLTGCGIVVQFDTSLPGYYTALILLGLGWSFTFLPATGLLTETYRPAEKARTQAANEFLIFSTVGVTALLAGPLEAYLGWAGLNALLLPLSLLPLVALLWQWLAKDAHRPQIRH
ncbi:Predicted arabinose efflux permease, MFS family [Modicisalibacter ilicicola DSM 19980]|uniref:Predicted arabinose efflux permease, MFS family n=1 Tax=Modicisalibacter ilicicola DSM 19980 TaxID=1121942 RepID=A0A1M4Y6X6_9GAMM|nr:MFS transporter [Halomonas ilicicola]SHF01554.1 Predicted arabinose efflux permease, MFS family [Halomonas ilicicola DSM 19980]